MNNLEAKLILQAYRPNGEDASDPFFREALEQAERDPELKKWFLDEMALETIIRSRLETAVPVPRNLKANLLAMQKLSGPVPLWLKLTKLLTATAVVALAIFISFMLIRPEGKSLDSFRQAMTLFSLQHEEHVTFEPRELVKIEEWLQDQGVAANFDLPPKLEAIGAQGCRIIDWNNQKVTMICFVSKKRDQHLDLFVMDNPKKRMVKENDIPHYAEKNGLVTAVWSKHGKSYLLAGKSRADIQNAIRSI